MDDTKFEPPPPTEQSRPHNPYMSLSPLVILVLLAISGFLFVQNNMLRSELSRASVSPTPDPSMNQEVTPSPADPTAAWQTYTDPKNLFSLRYPTSYRQPAEAELLEDPPNTLLAIESILTYPGTVLTTRNQFIIAKKPDLQTATSCYRGGRENTALTMKKTVNGETFYYSEIYGGAAAGTHDATEEYKVFHNGVCHELDLRHFESSDWNNPVDVPLAQAEQNKAFEELRQILSTFRFEK
jgi:hypothetical protein